MAEPSTVARPYAEAAFRLASAGNALAKWSGMIGALAQVAEDKRVRTAIANPALSDAQAAGVLISILAGKLEGQAENFVRVLAENKRLELLPEIHLQFEVLKNEKEGVVEAEVYSAFELNDAETLRSIPQGALNSGSSEIRNWIMTAGSVEGLRMRWWEYHPVRRTPAGTGTGIAFATWS